MTYNYNRTCKCGNVDSIEVSKREATFGLKDSLVYNLTCSKCGEKTFSSVSSSKPDIDEELLKEWSDIPEYYFSSQDEELLLAQHNENIDLYLRFIDQKEMDIGKRNILIEVLCVMIYDKENESDQESLDVVNTIKTELKKRSELVKQAESSIMDYIKEVSFPIIGIEYVNEKIVNPGFWSKLNKIWK